MLFKLFEKNNSHNFLLSTNFFLMRHLKKRKKNVFEIDKNFSYTNIEILF